MGSHNDQVGLPVRRMVDNCSLRPSVLHQFAGSKACFAEFLASAPHEFFGLLHAVFLYRGDVRDIVRDHSGGNVSGDRFNYMQHAYLSSVRPHLVNNMSDCGL